ncbi:hypothetical protein DY000_02046782 [Brassica cretica]|uniref:Uncharacterized protein n=1 Tax=Brassica cretica TaxID=69181 RepID=A0ABQ7F752_BRACR|nr:hypothetical protein DY000_02046782 [Brassica cretica]
MKGTYTNKKMGKIQDSIMKDVTEFIETRVEQVRASQIISDDDSSPFTNLSRVRINEMAVLKKKNRLVQLSCRASSCPSSSKVLYADLVIMEQLKNKDDLIEALDTQNATILAEMVEHKAAAAEQERLWQKLRG